MKNRTLIIVIIVAVALAAVIGLYFFQKNNASVGSISNAVSPSQPEQEERADTERLTSKLVTDDFELNIPAAWRQTAPTMGTSAMAVNAAERLDDPAAQKINFRTYLAVSYDTLQGKNLGQYLQSIEGQLRQTAPDAVFSQENDLVINGRAARALKLNMTRQGVGYAVLMVAVSGKGDDVWIMSFNTIKKSWDIYEETFSGLAESFSLKK